MGASYAVFTDTFKSDKKQVVEVGSTKIELVEPSTGLSLGSVEEMSDSDGLSQTNFYSFSIRNTGDSLASYKLYLLDDADTISTYEGTLLDDNYLRVGLVKNDIEIGPINIATTNRLIDSGTLEKSEENNYKLRLWLNFGGLSDTQKDTLDGQSKFLKLKLVGSQELGNTSNLANNWKDYTENELNFLALYTLPTRKLPETYTYNEKEYTKVKEVDVSEQQNKTVFLGEYQNGSELIAVIGQDGKVVAPQDSRSLFGGNYGSYPNVETIDLTYLDTSNVTIMQAMFYCCINLKNLNISSFDTSNVEVFGAMFENCCILTDLDLRHFDTRNAKKMQYMFATCQKLSNLDISTFDTSNVETMQYMFGGCNSIKRLDLRNFNTNKVTTMNQMFMNCIALESLNVTRFDTSNVTNMYEMFRNCSKLTSLDLTSFNTIKTENRGHMFYDCALLSVIKVGCNWSSDNGNLGEMFTNCKANDVTKICV